MFKRGEAPATARSPEASRKPLLCSGEDGQLEALMVLRVEGWPLCVTTVWQRDENAFKYAALGGQIEVLQWARANGCQWDENEICSLARMFDRRSKIEVLEWLRLPEVLGFRAALR
jgi:hypothetical protein